MTFLWPDMLWLLLAVPALVAVYVWSCCAGSKKAALRYANLNVVKEALGAGPRFRRHVPPILFLLALAVMIAAIAPPAADRHAPVAAGDDHPRHDVSGSMRATDVEPNRLVAAQAAAKAFVADLPRGVRVGVVSFAGTAAVVQPPTHGIARTSSRPSTGSSSSAAPPSAAGSSFRWPRSSLTPAST